MKSDRIYDANEFVCALTPPEQKERRESIRGDVLSRASSIERRETEWVLEFPGESELLATLMEYVRLERECCAFLRFELIAGAHGEAIWLKVGGPGKSLDMVGSFFGAEEERKKEEEGRPDREAGPERSGSPDSGA